MLSDFIFLPDFQSTDILQRFSSPSYSVVFLKDQSYFH